MYEMRSSVMPSDKPQSFSCSSLRMSAANRPFSLSDCVKSAFSEFGPGEAGNGDTEDDEEDGSRIMALNCMLPRSMRVSTRRVVECRGARREETSTVTFAHRLLFRGFCGSEEDVEASREDSGIQCRRVPGVGSGGGENGETWRKTGPRNSLNIELSTEGRSAGCYRVQRGKCRRRDIPKGERIMSSLFPSEVVISRSSSWPMSMKSFSARSIPISSHVCLIAA